MGYVMYGSLQLVNGAEFTTAEASSPHRDFTSHMISSYFHLASLWALEYPSQLDFVVRGVPLIS